MVRFSFPMSKLAFSACDAGFLGRGGFRASLAFSLAVSAAALAASSHTAAAGDALFSDQAEWAQSYDADAHLTVTRSTTPVLSPATFAATEQAIEHYRQIVSSGGWPRVPAGHTLRLGATGQAVVILRKRLMVSGDLDSGAGSSPVFEFLRPGRREAFPGAQRHCAVGRGERRYVQRAQRAGRPALEPA